MHLTRRLTIAVVILAVAGATRAVAKPRIVYDATTVTGRDIITAKGNGKKIRVRTGDVGEDATLLGVGPRGKRVTWLLVPPGVGDRSDLVVAKASRGRGRIATADLDGRVGLAAWTGDGRRLVFLHTDRATDRADLFAVNAKGKGLRALTADLAGGASIRPGPVLAAGPSGSGALLEWDFPDRRAVLLLDPRGRDAPVDLTAGLPPGEPGGFLTFASASEPWFTWREADAERPDLRDADGRVLAAAVRGARAIDGGVAAVVEGTEGDDILVLRPGALAWYETGGEVLAFRTAPGGDEVAAAVAPAGGGAPRVLLYGTGAAEPIDVLADHALEEVEEIRFFPDGSRLLLAVREDGVRRLYAAAAGGDSPVVDLAAGLEGNVGAFRTVAPDGTVLFAHLAPHGSTGEMYAWSPETGERTALVDRTGLIGIPGRAVASGATDDVLFSVVTMPDAENRLFLWRRAKDDVAPVSLAAHRPGTYFFTK